MPHAPTITTDSLREMLSSGEAVNIIDIRPKQERSEWFIPGSIHLDVYDMLKQNDATALNNVYLDKSVPLVTVCAGGKMSLVAADKLQQEGYTAFSLLDCMKGWSLAWNTAYQQFQNFELYSTPLNSDHLVS